MTKAASVWQKIETAAEWAEPIKRFATQGLQPDSMGMVSKFLGGAPKIKTPKGMEYGQGFLGNLKRGVKTSVGNTAHTIKSMRDKGVIPTITDQINQDLYKELADPQTYKKGKDYYVKAKAKFLPDRKVEAFTDRGGAIVRKRKVLTPLSVAFGTSGASLAGLSYVAQPKETPIGERVSRAAFEGAAFGLNPAVGTGVFLAPMLMGPDKKPQLNRMNRQQYLQKVEENQNQLRENSERTRTQQ